MSIHIDLVIPGLFDLSGEELGSLFLKSELPAFNRLLRYGRPLQNGAFDVESMLVDAMGWSELRSLPFAQSYAIQGEQNSEKILLFRAIHLKADLHNAIVLPLEKNQTNKNDINIIINDLKNYFKVDCNIREVQNGLWLMHLKDCIPAQHYPHYLSVIGKKAGPFIEQGKQSLEWYKLMNEMQMFMHQHEINSRRLESDLLPINSLWFWGAGKLSILSKKDIDWYCDDELLSRFARISGINCAKQKEVKTAALNCDSVIIDLALMAALKIHHEASLQTILSEMETQLFKPLLQRIKSHKYILRLRSGSSNDLILGPYYTYQCWKKPKSLIDFIRQ